LICIFEVIAQKIIQLKKYLSLVKFSHTIFALPFAIIGLFLAWKTHGVPLEIVLFVKVILCMIFARSAAMAFNRYLDREIDAKNPRTAVREIPVGKVTPRNALLFTGFNCAAFIATTFFINPLCFWLSPIALLVVLGYSYTKRFTFLCHFVLGLGLALAPLGAYLAVTASFAIIPILFSIIVLTWVTGFDIIYALQDQDFDTEMDLYSIPRVFGTTGAIRTSWILHIITASTMFYSGYALNGSIFYWIGASIFVILLGFQHKIVKANDLSKINLAFFTTNGIASVVFCTFFVLDFYL
jgi:4-hydroxybenzoate polyprenyltransferase